MVDDLWILLLLLIITLTNVVNSTESANNISSSSRKSRFLWPFHYKPTSKGLYDNPHITEDSFDFIIIGAGASGSVLANRLTEVPEWKVLLLEIGDEANSLTDIPYMAEFFQFTDYSWGYTAEQQNTSCKGCIDGKVKLPRGRVLGGTSAIDYMQYSRGNPGDYEHWPHWSYKSVLPYFKKSEDNFLDIRDDEYHQRGGRLPVSEVPYKSESARAFVQAAQEAGYPRVDYNGKRQIGVSYIQTTTKEGKRFSAEKTFLRPVRSRANLKISKNSRAMQLLISPDTKQAYGVRYIKDRQYREALVKKEVILCAGPFNSPQLLMLSGIGPKSHLDSLDIPIIKDLPVGRKLYDHLLFPGLNFLLNQSVVMNQEKETGKLDNYVDIKEGKGAFTVPIGGLEATVHLNTNETLGANPGRSDIELLLFSGGISGDKNLVYRKAFGISKTVYQTLWQPLENKPILQILPVLLQPKSSGHVELKSKNPYHWPRIQTNYLTDPDDHDIKALLKGIRQAQKIAASHSLQKYGAKLVQTPIPGCENIPFDSDDYWLCSLRQLSTSLGDQSTTCRMGAVAGEEAVVDSKLRVHGVHNLRVADASVVPTPLSGRGVTVSYMIGEKAADLIKRTWRKKGGYRR